ncbi:MAG: alpha/beta fold hydrolase [Candidatus Uhrbacteria bacterium]|nr:alpha/beta fold hydrolase [Candidatus Uhrbacteria bacterium]
MDQEHITIRTADGIDIAGIYRTPENPRGAVILLHMMPAVKESWNNFSNELEKAGYTSVAIDERGHGESIMRGKLDYKKFTEAEQQAKILDVEAAFHFLQQHGFEESQIIVIGASIGANLAIQFAFEHAQIPFVIALSPGLNYRGVKTDGFITQLHEGQRVVLVSSDDDDRESAVSCMELHRLNPSQTIWIEKNSLGHGTSMFDKDPALMQDLILQLPLN